MNNVNLDIDDYTDNEILDIAEIPQDSSSEIINQKFTLLIRKYLNGKDYKLAQFFHDAKEKVLKNLMKKDDNRDNRDTDDEVEAEKWLSNLYRDPVNENQKSKITDRRHITSIFDDNVRQVMSQKQLGINNNHPVNFIQDSLNPTLRQVIKHYITINSTQRYNSIPFENNFSSNSTSANFTINLNNPVNNIVSMKVESFNIPNSIYTFDPLYGNNVMMILTTQKDLDKVNWDNFNEAEDVSCCTRVNLTPGSYKNPIDYVNQLNLDIRRCQGNSKYPLLGPGEPADPAVVWNPADPCASADTSIGGCFMSLQAHLADPLSLSPRIVFVNTNVKYNIKLIFYKRVGLGDTFSPFDNFSDCSLCAPPLESRCGKSATYTNNLGYISGYRIENRIDTNGNTIYLNTNRFGSELSIVLTKASSKDAYIILSKINTLLPSLDGNITPVFRQASDVELPVWIDNIDGTGSVVFPDTLNPLFVLSYTMQQYANDMYRLLNLYRDGNNTSGTPVDVDSCNYYRIATVPLNLIASEYLFICVNDFNQNRAAEGMITVAEQKQVIFPLPSYKTNTWSSKSKLEDQILDLSADIICVKNKDTKLDTEIFVPTWPQQLTQSQIYSLNQINSNNKQQQESLYDITNIKDILASIPFQNNTKIDVSESSIRERHYFGPVKIDRLEISLRNSRGNLVNLNGQDWAFNLVLEQLYQY